MRGHRGARARPQTNTGDPVLDRALREMGEPAQLGPSLEYDKNGRLDMAGHLRERIAKLEQRQPPHRMRTAKDLTTGTVGADLVTTGDAATDNNFATMQAEIDRLHAILVERGMVQ